MSLVAIPEEEQQNSWSKAWQVSRSLFNIFNYKYPDSRLTRRQTNIYIYIYISIGSGPDWLNCTFFTMQKITFQLYNTQKYVNTLIFC